MQATLLLIMIIRLILIHLSCTLLLLFCWYIFVFCWKGAECPSPLLGVCPPCENCTTTPPPTTKPIIEEPSMVSAKLQNNQLPLNAISGSQPVQKSGARQNFKNKNLKGQVSSNLGTLNADKQEKEMMARSNFVFPWLKTVELYRKRRDSN